MRAPLAVLLLVGCGRVGFDARVGGDGGDGGAGSLALTYPRSELAAVLGASTISLVPTINDPAARFTVAPALPAGLDVDPVSGILSGTPTQIADGVSFTVTAATATATVTWQLELTVLPGYIVDTTEEAPDVDGGVGLACATAGGGCSLRAAIQTVNRRGTKQLVLLDAQSYALGAALESITNDVVIAGQGAAATTIRAATLHPAYPALALATTRGLWLRDLTIEEFGGTNGGALAVTAGTLDVDRCAFVDNDSPGSGGVLFINGGAHANLTRSTFIGNASLGGSGGGWGGVVDGEGAATAIVVTRSTATQNTTAWGSFSHITTGTTLRLENSTLYDNTSTTAGTLATPGGIYTLVNDTIVSNTNTATPVNSAGLYLYSAPCHYTVTNTLVAFNHDKTGAEYNCNRRDLSTTLTSGGGNVFSDSGQNCAAYFNATGDRLATDPGIVSGAPSDHGGPTGTILLAAGSPSIDGGDNASCPAMDQRGVARPVGGGCDIGAVEMK